MGEIPGWIFEPNNFHKTNFLGKEHSFQPFLGRLSQSGPFLGQGFQSQCCADPEHCSKAFPGRTWGIVAFLNPGAPCCCWSCFRRADTAAPLSCGFGRTDPYIHVLLGIFSQSFSAHPNPPSIKEQSPDFSGYCSIKPQSQLNPGSPSLSKTPLKEPNLRLGHT